MGLGAFQSNSDQRLPVRAAGSVHAGAAAVERGRVLDGAGGTGSGPVPVQVRRYSTRAQTKLILHEKTHTGAHQERTNGQGRSDPLPDPAVTADGTGNTLH